MTEVEEDLTVSVQGYGKVVIRKPEVFDEESYMEGIAEAIAKVITLTRVPSWGPLTFHPVLGYGTF